MKTLAVEPLEAGAFAPFGTVIVFDAARSRPANEGTAMRADTAALFDHAPGLAPILALYRTRPRSLPLALTLFERHPFSSQSFVSLSVPLFLVVVAPNDIGGGPDPGAAHAFIGRGGTGVSYRRGLWHMPIVALGTGGDFLMTMAEAGDSGDCVEHRLASPLTITGPADPDRARRTSHGA